VHLRRSKLSESPRQACTNWCTANQV
jgi:hypothetical protein